MDRIDPDFGLLDKLLASGTLTREAVHKIKLNYNAAEDKNRRLLDLVVENKKANELLSALRDSGQNHLVNYLNADGGKKLTPQSLNVTQSCYCLHACRICSDLLGCMRTYHLTYEKANSIVGIIRHYNYHIIVPRDRDIHVELRLCKLPDRLQSQSSACRHGVLT